MATFEVPENPCANVRSSCEAYLQTQGLVRIDETAIPKIVASIRQQRQVAWDAEDWHYASTKERSSLYILALDAINFCFWPHERYEYEDLATTLTNIARMDEHDASVGYQLSAPSLQTMTPAKMQALFSEHHEKGWYPPDIDVRCTLWNEIGTVLVDRFNGSCVTFLESLQDQSAVSAVRMLLEHFPGFRDIHENHIYFLKRAQICVGDWNAALSLNLSGMDQLTTFADYRVPQLLRHYDILSYSPDLAHRVDNQTEIAAGSDMELAIRAATVIAVERIVRELNDAEWNATTTDWYLWQLGETLQQQGIMKPHHRVRTTFY